jgi:subtilisin family serine protease
VALTLVRAAGQAPPQAKVSVLVKVQVPFAKLIEASLPLQDMELLAGQTGNPQIDSFMTRHGVRKLAPLYPNIVKIKKQSGLSDLQIATSIRRRFARRANRLRAEFHPPEISRTYLLELGSLPNNDLTRILNDFRADANVEFAEENKVVSVSFTPNDPYFLSSGSWGQSYDDLWGIKKIGASAAWDTTAGAGIIVAVVDTGIDYNHPDIASNIWINTGEIPNNGIDDDGNGFVDDVRGWDFIGSSYQNPTQSNNPIDHFGHGTHVAGTIAASGNNGIGVIGVAWQAQVMAVKGLDDNGNGIDSTLSNALIYAVNNGADVISNSWAGQGTSLTIADAVSYAYNLGAVVAAAAGNSSDDARNYYPANLPQVITVAATDHNDVQAYFSNWGDKIDVAAPGVDILSLRAAGTSMGTPVDANYTRADGTSMATPHVSGLAALILSQYPAYSNEDVRQVIRVSALSLGTPGFDLNYGYGRINAASAISVPDAVEAKILSPVDGTHVNGPVTISGVARGSTFAQYRLEYGAGQSPTAWTLIQSSSSPVAGGTLGIFDPTIIPDGFYVIRLTAYDLSNNAFTDRIELAVNYLSISSPIPPAVPVVASVFKPGAQVSVTGTAIGASFQDFRMDWAEGIRPSTGWSNVGISLSGGGASPLTNSLLGTWDTTAISKADYYTIRLSVDNAGFTSTAFTLVYLEPSLLSQNWPKPLDEGTYWSSGVVPATDASGNQKLTLVGEGTTVTSEFKTFSPDGATQTNSPLTYYGSLFQPATGDLDGNPGDEAAMTDVLMLRVFRSDNTSYALTPVQTMELANSQVVLEDLNNDSQLEIVAFGENYNTPNAYIYAYLRNGQLLNANFPITIANQNSDIDTYTKGNRLLVGDIDGDGNREILVLEGSTTSTFTPRLYANDGTPKTWSAPAYNGYPDQMLLADLDHNGKLETIFTCNCNSEKELHVLQPDGTERNGWPVILGSYPYNMTYLAVGDLNRDGREEIVVTMSNEILVFEDNGTSFSAAWPVVGRGYTSYGPVVLADINGDGLPEIITSTYGVGTAPNPLLSSASMQSTSAAQAVPPQISTVIQVDANGNKIMRPRVDVSAQVTSQNNYNAPQIVAYRSDASLARAWNMLGANGNQPFYMAKLTVGDFNKDGLTDIAATYWTIEGGGQGGWLKEGVITVLTTGTPYNDSANDWPMMYQNPRNTAVLIRDVTPPTVAITFPPSGTTVVGSVVVTANATDNVGVIGVQFQLDGTNLGPEATTAPWGVTWDTTAPSPGPHTLTAVARDAAGNRTTSAPVNVTVTHGPLASLSSSSLNYAAQRVGTSSAAQSVTVSNTGGSALTISGFSVTGDFSQSNNCGSSLSVGATCAVSITFAPTTRGSRTGVLTLNSDTSGATPTVSLTGTGLAPVATTSSASLAFGNQVVDTASAPLSLTLTNAGDPTLDISGISISGDFSQTNNCGTALAAGASCLLSVAFKPTTTGNRTGMVTIADDALGGSPQTVSLSGSGISPKGAFSPSSLTFASQLVSTSSTSQTLTLTSSGVGPLSISGFTLTGDFSQTNNCGITLAAGASCSVYIVFTPTARGNRTGMLTLNSNAVGSAPAANLIGTGVAPVASLSATSLSFSSQLVNTTSGAKSVTLTNSGDVTLNISGIFVNGAFAESNNCPTALGKGANCKINVTFTPTVSGSRTGVLSVSDDSLGGSPQTVSLSGTGVDYSVVASPTSPTVAAGQLVTFTVTVSALSGNYNQSVSLACSGLPASSSCNFSPSSLTPNSGSANSTLKLSTTARQGSNGTPAGSYTVTITGTAHNTHHSVTVQLTVN